MGGGVEAYVTEAYGLAAFTAMMPGQMPARYMHWAKQLVAARVGRVGGRTGSGGGGRPLLVTACGQHRAIEELCSATMPPAQAHNNKPKQAKEATPHTVMPILK